MSIKACELVWDAYLCISLLYFWRWLKVSQSDKGKSNPSSSWNVTFLIEHAVSRWKDMMATRLRLYAGRTNHIMPARGYVVTLEGFFNVVRNVSPGNKKYRSYSFHTRIHYLCTESRSKAVISEQKIVWFDQLLWLCALSDLHHSSSTV